MISIFLYWIAPSITKQKKNEEQAISKGFSVFHFSVCHSFVLSVCPQPAGQILAKELDFLHE